MTSILLRRASLFEVAALTAIRRDAILTLAAPRMGEPEARAWAESSAETRVLRAVEHHEVWSAERDGAVVGWVEVDRDRIEGLYVRPDVAGRGVGSILLAQGEAVIRAAGYATAGLEASPNAEEFYRRRGYEPQSQPVAEAGRQMLKPL